MGKLKKIIITIIEILAAWFIGSIFHLNPILLAVITTMVLFPLNRKMAKSELKKKEVKTNDTHWVESLKCDVKDVVKEEFDAIIEDEKDAAKKDLLDSVLEQIPLLSPNLRSKIISIYENQDKVEEWKEWMELKRYKTALTAYLIAEYYFDKQSFDLAASYFKKSMDKTANQAKKELAQLYVLLNSLNEKISNIQ